MITRRGRPRLLSQPQIQRVLDWYAHRQEWIARYGTRKDLAAQLNLTDRVIRCTLEELETVESDIAAAELVRSGPPPIELTSEALEAIRTWWSARKNCGDMQISTKALATQLGVGVRYIYNCIRRYGPPRTHRERGGYKPPHTQLIQTPIDSRGNPPRRPTSGAVVSELLRRWTSPSVEPRPRRRR